MVLARNQQPTPGCVRCSQPSEAAYFKYYPNFGTLRTIHVICTLWSWPFVLQLAVTILCDVMIRFPIVGFI